MLTFKAALFFVILGVVFMIKNPFHKRGFLRTQGVITDYKKEQSEGKEIYFAKVKFPLGEEEILFTDQQALTKKPEINKFVDVLYNKENPQEAEIESNFSIIFPWLFVLAAFIILIYNLKQIFVL